MRGGSISNRRIVSWDEEKVRFRYKDYRETSDKKSKEMELALHDFVRRVLMHVPEPGQKVVRSYGIFAGCRRADLNRCRAILGQGPVQETEVRTWQECVAKLGDKDPSRCPVCGAQLIQREVFRPDFRGETRKFPLQEAA